MFEIKKLHDQFAYFIGINFCIEDLREYIEMLHKSYSRSSQGRIPKEQGHAVLFIDEGKLIRQQFKTYNGIGLLLKKKTSSKNTILIKGGADAVILNMTELPEVIERIK